MTREQLELDLAPVKEEWRPVVGFEGLYEISDLGRVRSLPRLVRWGNCTFQHQGRMLKQTLSRGYLLVGPSREGEQHVRLVHQLVLEAFVGPKPPGKQCRHLDGNRQNNRLENLCWGTPKENTADSEVHGTARLRGERNGYAKLTNEQVLSIRSAHGSIGAIKLGQIYSVSRRTVYAIWRNENWVSVV